MTPVKDPHGNAVTVSYDSAERVGTITRPDSTTQVSRRTRSRAGPTAGPRAARPPATLLAESASNYTDPNGNLPRSAPTGTGLGQTGQTTDALGNVTTYDLNSNGLPIVRSTGSTGSASTTTTRWGI